MELLRNLDFTNKSEKKELVKKGKKEFVKKGFFKAKTTQTELCFRDANKPGLIESIVAEIRKLLTSSGHGIELVSETARVNTISMHANEARKLDWAVY